MKTLTVQITGRQHALIMAALRHADAKELEPYMKESDAEPYDPLEIDAFADDFNTQLPVEHFSIVAFVQGGVICGVHSPIKGQLAIIDRDIEGSDDYVTITDPNDDAGAIDCIFKRRDLIVSPEICERVRLIDIRRKPVCDHCGSADIRIDATAAWDAEAGEWSLAGTQDAIYCETCGCERDLKWVQA